MLFLTLSSLLGVVSLFLCKSLMSWGVIFSEFNREASLFIAIICHCNNFAAKLEFEVVAI